MYHPFPDDRANAIERARTYVSQDPLFLDTETTGLTDRDEICEIAVVDLAGKVLINSLVKPVKKADWTATAEIHRITPEMIQNSPTFRDLLPELNKILTGRMVLVYNVEFDQGKLWGSANANGLTNLGPDDFAPWWFPYKDRLDAEPPEYKGLWHCAMELYAVFHGDWSEYRQSYTWVRLATAAKQCGVELVTNMHRALGDAEMVRRIVKHIAEQDKKYQMSFLDEEQA